MKTKAIPLLTFAFALSLIAPAAVPLTWTVDVTRVAPVTFDAYHGETLALEAVFKDASRPLDLTGKTAKLYWQTNGMESVYWSTNAAVTATNHIAATFTGAMDPGAASVRGFLAVMDGTNSTLQLQLHPPTIYRAAFVIRFRPSPGYSPGTIAYPPKTLDLAHTVVVNPPWPTQADYAATTTAMRVELKTYIDEEISGAGLVTPSSVTNIASSVTSNVVTKSYVEGLGIESGLDTNAVAAVVTNHVTSGYLCTVDAAKAMTNEDEIVHWDTSTLPKSVKVSGTWGRTAKYGGDGITVETTGLSNGVMIDTWGWPTGMGNLVADGQLPLWIWSMADEPASQTSYNQLANNVNAISAHLNAEDARFVSTNYDSTVRVPEAYVEIKVSNDWITVWREMSRWTNWTGSAWNWTGWQGFHAWHTNVSAELERKADRAWGVYDSETGEYSPDGVTQISSSNIVIAANMSYKRVVTTGGAVWVLQCHGGTANFGGDTNGYFRIADDLGNVQFEIVKGNQRELGADAGGVSVGANNVMTINYSVEIDAHPSLRICTDIGEADWKAEGDAGFPATVNWSGSSGAWIATVTPIGTQSKLFVTAFYLGGAETVIRHGAPVEMQYIYIGGTKYQIGVGTVSGTKVLTLTEQ